MIEWIGANIEVYGPWLVGGMAMFETALIIGLVLPTEPTLIVATASVRHRQHRPGGHLQDSDRIGTKA